MNYYPQGLAAMFGMTPQMSGGYAPMQGFGQMNPQASGGLPPMQGFNPSMSGGLPPMQAHPGPQGLHFANYASHMPQMSREVMPRGLWSMFR